ncbi:hypothetical protein [Pseudomonas nitroreducens]|uniref:hypothetical protein n=1 Tax=Pseudomonas nitroreducens TaxID=46680 RepID=UPI003CC82A1D
MEITRITGCISAALATGVFNLTANATPWGMARNAEIGMTDGMISICIPSAEKNDVAIASLSVTESELNNGERHTPWDVEMKPGGPFISLPTGGCLNYGAELAGYTVNTPASELQAGVTYSVRLNRFVRNPRRTDVLFYTAVFCSVQRGSDWQYLPYVFEESGSVVKPQCQ